MNVSISDLTLIIEQNILETLTNVIEHEQSDFQTPLSVISDQTLVLSKNVKKGSCSICLEMLNVVEHEFCFTINKCKHIFHEKCIVKWLIKHPTCPICRINIMEE